MGLIGLLVRINIRTDFDGCDMGGLVSIVLGFEYCWSVLIRTFNPATACLRILCVNMRKFAQMPLAVRINTALQQDLLLPK